MNSDAPGDTQHPLLIRQLRRVGISQSDLRAQEPRIGNLLLAVNRAYVENDREHYLAQRSQEISSREMSLLHAELSASQARLASLVSLSSDWVWEQDENLRFTYISATPDQAGSSLQDLIGKVRDVDAFPPVPGSDPAEYHRATAERKSFRNFVYGHRLPDGSPMYLRISGEPVFDNGEFVGYRGVACDVTQATLAEQTANRLACFDCLTGLANRSMFMRELDIRLSRANREGHTLALMFIDLDRFKNVNDSLGHCAGDEMLRIIANRLTRVLRKTDFLARLGGDEFVVLIDDRGGQQALTVLAERLLAQLRRPLDLMGTMVHTSGSVGIALYPGDGEDAATLIRCADTAMYQAKARGKNNFQFFTAELAHRVSDCFAMGSDLHRAIDLGELRLHYQPLFDADSARFCGVEALVRWQHASKGLLLPGQFLPLAQETGMIARIASWVIANACRQVKSWRAAGVWVPQCSVNLGLQEFASEHLVEEISIALASAGIEPEALQLEIAEHKFMADPERIQWQIQRLRSLGVGLAIDDFGAGYSSLSHLKQPPANTLKIDRSFIQSLPGDPERATIVGAVVAMAHTLGMKVVAEGVETEDQLELVRRLGCDQVQGFLLGRPLSAGQLAAHLKSLPASQLPTEMKLRLG
jgi:diguanylate cyclase (GGDEF)-like protein/PAS domain S-box-containing protein